MNPTLYRTNGFRYFFFSREETRMHIHVTHADGEAKFWLSPEISLASQRGLSAKQLLIAERFVQDHQMEMQDAWRNYFPPRQDT
jgi:hypothetical protein